MRIKEKANSQKAVATMGHHQYRRREATMDDQISTGSPADVLTFGAFIASQAAVLPVAGIATFWFTLVRLWFRSLSLVAALLALALTGVLACHPAFGQFPASPAELTTLVKE